MFLMALLRNDCMNDGLVVLVILRDACDMRH